jgi:hypothetical protein
VQPETTSIRVRHLAVDDDEAVDQLVDELSARVHTLRCLLSGRRDTSPWPAAGIRDGATAAIRRIRDDHCEMTADAVISALWPQQSLRELSPEWLETPLGRLLVAETLARGPCT